MQSTETLHVKENGEDRRSGRRYRSTNNRMLVALVLIFALATVALAIALAVTIVKEKDSEKTSSDDVCLTNGCVAAASRIGAAIDNTVNPCDNIFDYACGNYIRKHVIPEDKASYGTFVQLIDDVAVTLKYLLEANGSVTEPEVVTKLRQYYKGCISTEIVEDLGLSFIHQHMKDLGGWPLMYDGEGGGWIEDNFNLTDFLINTRKGTNDLPLIDIYVAQDDKKPTKHILTIDQPTLGMPSREYLLKERNDTTLMAYQNYWKNLAVGLGAQESSAEAAAKNVVDLEIEIANITVRKEDRRDPEKLYNLMKVGDLERNFSGFDWLRFVNGVMGIVNMSITEDEPIVVVSPQYFSRLFDVLSRHDARTIADYVVGLRIMGKTFYLPDRIRDIKLEYTKVLTGKETVPPRWRSCTTEMKDKMPQVLGRLFVQETFTQEAKEDVLLMVDNLLAAFNEMVGDLQWMDEETKRVAREKAAAMVPQMGYPELVYNVTELNRLYENMTMHETDPLRTLINFSEDFVRKNLMRLRKDYDKDRWRMSPAAVNAYYSPSTNYITFPAAILQPPFYSNSEPSYLNYGGIGFVIGHEITHGFDDQGRHYDKDGNLKQWWNDDVIRRFKDQKQCIIDQYNNFTVPGTGGMHLNGINTQGENIADNGGIKESFQAYRKLIADRGKEEPLLPGLPYTQNQLFFISAAQIWCEQSRDKEKIRLIRTGYHSIDKYRAIGPLQNFDEFSKAFNCPQSSYMNRQNKCSVW